MATHDDWVSRFHDESPRDGIARLVAMHRPIADRIRAVSRTDKLLQVAVLAMSALTSGALWVLVGVALPVIASWIGAALSTLVTALIDLWGPWRRRLKPARSRDRSYKQMPYWSIYCLYCRGYIADALLECLPTSKRLLASYRSLFQAKAGAAFACPLLQWPPGLR